MGWRAGTNDRDDSGEAAGAQASVATTPVETKDTASKRNVYLLIGGLVVTGIVAGWNWVRGLPRDEP